MDSSYRAKLISRLMQHARDIYNFNNINELIMIHEIMLNTLYCQKPLFYKMLFKHSRFHAATAICSIYYCHPTSTLKTIKDFIISHENLVSVNTLNSLLIQLRVSGRMDIYRKESNRRESLYRPSLKMIQEVYDLIQSILKPYRILYNEPQSGYENNAEELLPVFFSRYGDFVFNHISMIDLLPEAALFLEKDAGHMIMLILYKEFVLQNNSRIILSHKKIAAYCHVSRTHVSNLLREAQAAGFIFLENNLFIALTDKFIHLFRMYFSIYMAQILYSVNATSGDRATLPLPLNQ